MPKRLSASSAAMHMSCHASANLDLAIPGWVDPERDDMAGAKGVGTRMHAAFAEVMTLTATGISRFAWVLSYVAELRATRKFKVLIEEEMTAAWLPSSPKTTADLVLYVQDEIHVLDLKWGKIEVSVFDNHQLMFYAVTYAALAPKAKGVTVHILQPNIEKLESLFIPAYQLKQFMEEAIAADLAITAGSVTFGPSDHCTFCPANPHSRGDKGKPLCPVMMGMLYPKIVNEDEILSL